MPSAASRARSVLTVLALAFGAACNTSTTNSIAAPETTGPADTGAVGDPEVCELGASALCTCAGCDDDEVVALYEACVEDGSTRLACWADEVVDGTIDCADAPVVCDGADATTAPDDSGPADTGPTGDPAVCELGTNAVCTCVECSQAEAQTIYDACLEHGKGELQCWADQVVDDRIDCDQAAATCSDGGASSDSAADTGCTELAWYADGDRDGHGDPDDMIRSCDPVGIYDTHDDGDCCDLDASAFPGQREWFFEPNLCGAFDYDCDGVEALMLDTCEPQPCPPGGGWWLECPVPPCGAGPLSATGASPPSCLGSVNSHSYQACH